MRIPEGCLKTGNMIYEGKGQPVSYSGARIFYDKACSLSDGEGCYRLGKIYDRGIGINQSIIMGFFITVKHAVLIITMPASPWADVMKQIPDFVIRTARLLSTTVTHVNWGVDRGVRITVI